MKTLIDNIYRSKVEMMGLAILSVMFFHGYFGADHPDGFLYSFKRFGEIGVDIFLVIGAFTCTLSYMRCKSVAEFYMKRAKRLLPAYFIIWIPIHVFNMVMSGGSIADCLYNISLLPCMENKLLNWYILAIIFYYLLTPIYVKFIQSYRKLMLIPLVIVVLETVLMFQMDMINVPFFMFWLRLPIYLTGVNLAVAKDIDVKINNFVVLLTAVASVVVALLIVRYDVSNSPVELRRLVYIPLAYCIIYFITFKSKIFAFFGTVSLELYLLHEYIQDMLCCLFHFKGVLAFLVSVLLALMGAVVINRAVSFFMKKINA